MNKFIIFFISLLLFTALTAAQTPPLMSEELPPLETPGLVAHWKLDEGSGTIAHDSSGNGYDGVITNGTWSNDVPPGVDFTSSLRLDGDGYVDTAVFDLDDSFTISVWSKPDDFDRRALIAKHTGTGANLFIFGYYYGGFHVNIRDENTSAGHPLYRWNLLTLVAQRAEQGTQLTLYRNGVSQWTRNLSARMEDLSAGRVWTIGQDWDGNNRTDYFIGNLADLRIYDRALTPEEVADLALDHARICEAPTAERTIRQAVSDWGCDIVQVAAGEFPTPTMQPQTGLILRGAGRGATRLLNGGEGPPLMWLENNIRIEGMTLEGFSAGPAEKGSVLFIQRDAVVELVDLAFVNNRDGAIYNTATLTVRDSLFQNNQSIVPGAAIDSAGSLFVQNSSFRSNSGNYSGAVNISNGTAVFEETTFIGNNTLDGAALRISNAEVRINKSQFSDNRADRSGSAALIANSSTVIVEQSEFLNNRSTMNGGAIKSAGTYNQLLVEDSTFVGNSAGQSGGAVANYSGSDATFNSVTLHDNSAGFSSEGSVASVFYQQDAAAVFSNSTISGNKTDPGINGLAAAVISLGTESALSLNHVTLANNDSDKPYDAHGVWISNGTAKIANTILDNNGETNCRLEAVQPDGYGIVAGDSSCGAAQASGELNLSPLADNGGFTLTHAIGSDSAANNAAYTYCLGEDQRDVARNLEACDAGAFEYRDPLALYLPVLIR